MLALTTGGDKATTENFYEFFEFLEDLDFLLHSTARKAMGQRKLREEHARQTDLLEEMMVVENEEACPPPSRVI